MPPGPNAELVGFRPVARGQVTMEANGEAFVTEAVSMVGPMTSPYFTYEYDRDLDAVKVWREHPEIPQPGIYDEVALALRARALEKPATFSRSLWNVVPVFTCHWWRKWCDRGIRYHDAVAGWNELGLILTYRPTMAEQWHLSVVPIRFGVLHDWEVQELARAFRMTPPVRTEGKRQIHFFW